MIFSKLNSYLKGTPDQWITIGLFVIAGFAVLVAMRASPLAKAVVLAWLLAP